MTIIHGGTDSGPPPRLDLSTNANPYGPSPFASQAMATPITAYPDPAYRETRRTLAAHAGTDEEAIVVGAGATELIYRLIQCVGGPVGMPYPGFGEYAHAAQVHDQGVRYLPSHPDDGAYDLEGLRIAFITQPGSPDGLLRDQDWCHRLQTQADALGCVLVWDMAYELLCEQAHPQPDPFMLGTHHVALYAPNKAHGCTGLRAGWLRADPDLAQQLRTKQMSWILSAPGAAFLRLQASVEADQWVATHRDLMERSAKAIHATLMRLGWPTHRGHTPWVLTKPPTAEWAPRLRRDHGIKVRPLDSQGKDGWVRIGVPHHHHLDEVITVFEQVNRGYE